MKTAIRGDMMQVLAETGWFLREATTPFGGKRYYFCHPQTGQIRETDIYQTKELAAYDFINKLKEEK